MQKMSLLPRNGNGGVALNGGMCMTEIPPKLKWACRRGMLELDVLLGRFLETAYLKLRREDQQQFEKVLDCSDQDLFNWLMDKTKPNDANIAEMISKIRQHARNHP